MEVGEIAAFGDLHIPTASGADDFVSAFLRSLVRKAAGPLLLAATPGAVGQHRGKTRGRLLLLNHRPRMA